MAALAEGTYFDDPNYQAALEQCQRGEWEAGLLALDRLVEAYPLEQELRALRHEMKLRARVDQDEIEDRRRQRQRTAKNSVLLLALLVGTLALVLVCASLYSGWVGDLFNRASAQSKEYAEAVERMSRFNDGRTYLAAGRASSALALFTEIQKEDPTYPGIEESIAEAQRLAEVEVKYTEALRLMEQGEREQAKKLLEEIQQVEPYYLDVGLRLADIERSKELDALLEKARKAYENGDWPVAVETYEELRSIDKTYRQQEVERQLYESYLNAAAALAANEVQTIESLQQMQDYYRKAKAIRPLDAAASDGEREARELEALQLAEGYEANARIALEGKADSLRAISEAQDWLERAAAQRPDDLRFTQALDATRGFLRGEAAFKKREWDTALVALESVYAVDPDFANGVARQMLYDAYVARGEVWMAGGDFVAALSDFQRAAVLAEEEKEVLLRVYESRAKVAEMQGLLGQYDTAVLMYREAIEMVGLRQLAAAHYPKLLGQIEFADLYFDHGNYSAAFREYRKVFADDQAVYRMTAYVIQEGDYLALIARRYKTTLRALISANLGSNVFNLEPGRGIVVPVFAGE